MENVIVGMVVRHDFSGLTGPVELTADWEGEQLARIHDKWFLAGELTRI